MLTTKKNKIASVGLKRAGNNAIADHKRVNPVSAGLDRNGDTEYLSYGKKHHGGRDNTGARFDSPGAIGLKRSGDNRVGTPHPGTRRRGTLEREKFARNNSEWNGADGQLANLKK